VEADVIAADIATEEEEEEEDEVGTVVIKFS
jgi:hypothetical protein